MRVSGAAVRDQNGSVVRTDPLPVFRRRIAVLLLLLLACVALGGWVLVAPALPVKGAVVVEPPADVDLRRAPSDAHAVPAPAASSSIVAVAAPVVSPEASAAGDDGSPRGDNDVDLATHELGRQPADTIASAFGPPILDRDCTAVAPTQLI